MTHSDVTIISQVLAVTHDKLSACYGAIQVRLNCIHRPFTLNNCRVSCKKKKKTWLRKVDLGFFCSSPIWRWDSMVGIAALYELNGPGAHIASYTIHTGAISWG
jgi:hypothetical protein